MSNIIKIMSDINKRAYVWYHKKNCVVRVLDYDSQTDSYTIEYKGRIIDTTTEFIDKNIDSKCMKLNMDIMTLEEKLADLEFYTATLKDRLKENDDKYYLEKKLIVADLARYKGLYEKYVSSNFTKGSDYTETIVLNNFTMDKSSKFLWKDLNNYAITPMIDLYTQFIDLKSWLKCHYFSYGANTKTYEEIEKWTLQKDEYIVGVYYVNDTINTLVTIPNNISFGSGFHTALGGGIKNSLIFYTNYGNITDVVHYNNNMFFEAKKVVSFRVNKNLNTKMINIVNKSISSGNRVIENVNKKTSKELYEFIKEVSEF